MRKILIILVLFIFLIQLARAAEVCVVVDYGKDSENEPDSKCVDVNEGIDGYQLLQKTGFNILWSNYYNKTFFGVTFDYGHSVCRISGVGEDVDYSLGRDGTGCEYHGKYWNFILAGNGKWNHMPVGYDGGPTCWNRDLLWDKLDVFVHYCAQDGDTIGMAFGPELSEPQMFIVNISKVYIDGEREKKLEKGSGKINDVFPGSKIEFKLEFENLYNSDTEIDVTDISTEGTIEEIDNGADIEEELSDFDLKADKKDTKILEFIIPLEVEDKDRLLKIEVQAKDNAGIRYEREFRYDLQIEKDDHKLKITKADLNKDLYACGETALLDFSVINLGKREENVNLEIISKDLGINFNENFELTNDPFKSSSKYEKRVNLLLPDNLDKKTYPISITANYGPEKETKELNLVIDECEKRAISNVEEATEIQAQGVEKELSSAEEQPIKETRITGMAVTGKKASNGVTFILTAVFGFLILMILVLVIAFRLTRI